MFYKSSRKNEIILLGDFGVSFVNIRRNKIALNTTE
jgi:hypothetical protein